MRFYCFNHIILLISIVSISACSTTSKQVMSDGNSSYYDSQKPKIEKQKVGRPYQINGVWYTPEINNSYDEIGIASWYGPGFHGKSTANGERFDENKISAAHTTLPLPSYVEVTNLDNGKKLYVRVNDRGPFADDRIIDLSRRAAELLGSKNAGLARVRVRIAEPPLNITLISPDGSIQVGKGYRPKVQQPVPQTLIANNQAINRQYAPPIQSNVYNDNVMGNNAPLYQDEQYADTQTQNLIPIYQDQAPYNTIQDTENFETSNASVSNNNQSYSIKVGVFANQNNVNILRQNIASLGNVKVNQISRQGRILSEVSLEGYKNQQELRDTVDALSQYGINDPVIVNNSYN